MMAKLAWFLMLLLCGFVAAYADTFQLVPSLGSFGLRANISISEHAERFHV